MPFEFCTQNKCILMKQADHPTNQTQIAVYILTACHSCFSELWGALFYFLFVDSWCVCSQGTEEMIRRRHAQYFVYCLMFQNEGQINFFFVFFLCVHLLRSKRMNKLSVRKKKSKKDGQNLLQRLFIDSRMTATFNIRNPKLNHVIIEIQVFNTWQLIQDQSWMLIANW